MIRQEFTLQRYRNAVPARKNMSGLPSDKAYPFTILHPSGKSVLQGQIYNGDQINVITLPSGLYILNLNGQANKIIIE